MRKPMRVTFILFGLVAVAALSLTTVFALTDHGDSSSKPEDIKGPILQVFDGLVAEGVISEEQAEEVISRLKPALLERINHFKRQTAFRLKKEVHQRLHNGFKQLHRGRLERVQFRLLLEFFGVEPRDLRSSLGQGQSIASVGEDLGIGVDQIVDTLVQPIQKYVEHKVSQGLLSEEEVARRIQEARAKITEHIQRKHERR